MRKRFEVQFLLGQTPIEDVLIPLKSRDELPPTLAGLQWMFTTPEINEKVFQLLDQKVVGDKKQTGRPGMDLWHILVLGVTRLALDCDYDRLEDMANHHSLLRQMLGLTAMIQEDSPFHHKTLSQNVCHVDEELLAQINEIVVQHGRAEFKKNDAEKIAAKTDSYVLETNVHFPTDTNLLWDSARKSIELLGRLCDQQGVAGWRKFGHWKKTVKSLMRTCQSIAHGGGKNKEERLEKAARRLVNKALELSAKVALSIEQLQDSGLSQIQLLSLEKIKYFEQMLNKHIDLVRRRLVEGQTIPHAEKLFSIFEPHTEWINKGKTRPPVELGHKILVTSDQHQLILDYKVMERSADNQETLALAQRLIERFGEAEIESLSMDKGFSDMADRVELEKQIPMVVMPKKGKRSQSDQEREKDSRFKKLRHRHSAIESNINALEHHGLNRCPDKGLEGFKRYVGLGILAYNLHRIGRQLLEKQRQAAEGVRLKLAA